jgi:plasmid stabilization system protein ParE
LHGIYRRHLALRGTDGPDGAEALLESLVKSVEGLAVHPEKGPVVEELEVIGIPTFRQLSRAPFRFIYRIDGEDPDRLVTVLVIADGRRDFRTLLEERLLR